MLIEDIMKRRRMKKRMRGNRCRDYGTQELDWAFLQEVFQILIIQLQRESTWKMGD